MKHFNILIQFISNLTAPIIRLRKIVFDFHLFQFIDIEAIFKHITQNSTKTNIGNHRKTEMFNLHN